MIAPPKKTGPYSAYELKTILTTLIDHQSEENNIEVCRKVSEALSDNVFGRTPLQIQSLYGDMKKLYINERRFRVILKSPSIEQADVEELKAIVEQNNMVHLMSIIENPELLKLMVTIFSHHH